MCVCVCVCKRVCVIRTSLDMVEDTWLPEFGETMRLEVERKRTGVESRGGEGRAGE